MLALPQTLLKAYPGVLRFIGNAWPPVAVGAVCFVAARLGLVLRAHVNDIAVFSSAGGIATAALVVFGRDARWQIAASVAVALIVANLLSGCNLPLSIALTAVNIGEFLVAAWLVRRWVRCETVVSSLRCVLGFLSAVVIAAALGAAGAVLLVGPLFQLPAGTTWLHGFSSDAAGMIATAPLVIALRNPPPRGEIAEGAAALVVLAVMTTAIIVLPPARWETIVLAVLMFPVLLWIASRCPPLCSAAAGFVVALTVVSWIAFRIGNLSDAAVPVSERILVAQTAIIGVALCAYVLGALFAERRRHETAIKESEARLQEALKAGAVMAFEWNPHTGTAQRSENSVQILGIGTEVPPHHIIARIHPADRGFFEAVTDHVRPDSPAYSVTFRLRRPDGREVWLEETARGEFDAGGRIVRIKGLTRDITQRKRAEARQDLLIAELDHRVKNVLARVAVVTMHTRQGHHTIEEFVQALDGRLKSMSAAHALLSQSRWSGVGLTDLIHRQLAPYTSDANTTIAGPDVMLTAAETQALAMVMHELVTNAAKYGALSIPQGRVLVNWNLTGACPPTLTITWLEQGGPPVTAPHDASYGSRLIRDLIPHELDGTVELTFPIEGVCCTIAIRLDRREN